MIPASPFLRRWLAAGLGVLLSALPVRAGFMEELAVKLREDWVKSTPSEALVAKWVQSQKPDGSWPDINYQDKHMMAWEPGQHPARLQALACAAWKRNDPKVVAAVRRGIDYWRRSGPVSANWWHVEIGVPMNLGQVCLLLESRLGGVEREICEAIRSRKTINRAGQNGVWAAEVDLQAALVLRDETLAGRSINEILSHLKVPMREGLQTDYSFQQHGPQLHFGNYGLAFASDMVNWMARVKGTPFLAKDDPRLGILRNYLTRGLAVATWQGSLDQSGMGRLTYPFAQGQGGAGGAIERLLGRMQTIDPDFASLYRETTESIRPGGVNRLTGLRLFHRSDFAVQRRTGSYVSVRMTSERMKGSERSGEQNLLGHYMGDGVMWLLRRGDEYRDVFPVLDWRRLPGVTCPVEGPLPAFPALGGSPFAGGVTDGTNGCLGMDLRRGGLAANKAWFFAGDQLVCLGAGIRTDAEVRVETTVNQARLRGEAWMQGADGVRTNVVGTGLATGPVTFTHDGWHYVFPRGKSVGWSVESQSGEWKRVVNYSSMPAGAVTLPMFRLGVPHGTSPAGASYTYAVVPASGSETPVRWDGLRVRVLSNTPQVQAVLFTGPRLIQAVFREAGTLPLDGGLWLKVSGPCAVQVAPGTGAMWVADPTQKQDAVTVEFAGVRWVARLARGEEAGRTERR